MRATAPLQPEVAPSHAALLPCAPLLASPCRVCRPQASAQEWERKVELNPDKWFRYDYVGFMDSLRERVAAFVGARKEDIVFVPNASHGINAVLRSLKLKAGEKILYLNTAYRMVVNTIDYLNEWAGDATVMANVSWPLSDQQVRVGSDVCILPGSSRSLLPPLGRGALLVQSRTVSPRPCNIGAWDSRLFTSR
jgi:hypothetical protein